MLVPILALVWALRTNLSLALVSAALWESLSLAGVLRPVSVTSVSGDSSRPACPCLCPAVADVELCHWPCQSLHTLCHPSLPPMSSYPPPKKRKPHYVQNLYKREADAIKLSSCFDKTPSSVCFFWAINICHPAQPRTGRVRPGSLLSPGPASKERKLYETNYFLHWNITIHILQLFLKKVQ